MLLALIFSLSLGAEGLVVDENNTTAPYAQEAQALSLLSPVSFFGNTLFGSFGGSPSDWTAIDNLYLSGAVQGSSPDAFLAVDLFGLQNGELQLINSYELLVQGIGASPRLLALQLKSPGSGDFSSLKSIQFTWEGEIPGGSALVLYSLVGSQGAIDPVITSVGYANGEFQMTWTGTGVLPVNIERRSSLTTGQWAAVAQGVASGTYTDTNPPMGQAFYRVVVP